MPKTRNQPSSTRGPRAASTPRRPRRWQRIAFPLLAILLGLTLALTTLEIGLRVAGFEPTRMLSKRNLRRLDVRQGFHCYASNPHGEFQPLPDFSQGQWEAQDNDLRNPQNIPLDRLKAETPYCVTYDISSQGYRDREYAPQPPEGVVRIALIGDSFTFGEGVQADGTLPAQLSQLLGPGYEVVNCGQVGVDTEQELSNAYAALLKLRPHHILVCFLVNDISLTSELIERQDFINDYINFRDTHLAEHQKGKWYAGPSILLRWAGTQRDLRIAHRDTLQWYLDSYDPRYNAENIDRLALNLLEFTTLPNVTAAMVVYPLLEGLYGVYPLASIHDQVRQMALDAGLPSFDLEPTFVGQDARTLWAHEADHHPNRRAHAMAAKTVAAWLQSDRPALLKRPAPPEAAPPPADDPALGQAMQLLGQRQFLPARRLILQVLRRTPQNASARAALGYLCFLEGRATAAQVQYEQALALRPDWADIEINLAAILATQTDAGLRDTGRAIQLAEKACAAVKPPSLAMLDTLVLAYGEAGRFEEALSAAESAAARADKENNAAAAAEFRKKLAVYRDRRDQAKPPGDPVVPGSSPAPSAEAAPSGPSDTSPPVTAPSGSAPENSQTNSAPTGPPPEPAAGQPE